MEAIDLGSMKIRRKKSYNQFCDTKRTSQIVINLKVAGLLSFTISFATAHAALVIAPVQNNELFINNYAITSTLSFLSTIFEILTIICAQHDIAPPLSRTYLELRQTLPQQL
jgi:hypothetical protein